MTLYAGVDVGGTKVLAAAVDQRGIIAKRVLRATDPRAGSSSLVAALDQLFSETEEPPLGIGVGVAAWVGYPSGRVVFAPNLHYEIPDIKSLLSERYGLPVTVENDANAAAWGEREFGAGKGSDEMLMVTVGTGIGGGIVTGGGLMRGHGGFAAEIGHMTILENGPLCACGERGCLEALASGTAITRMAREGVDRSSESILLRLAEGDPEAITGELVSSAAEQGDAFAASLLEQAGRHLGIGLGNLAHLLDPEIIVVGGGGAEAGEVFLDPAREELQKKLVGRREPPPVVVATLGNDAGVIGAAALSMLL